MLYSNQLVINWHLTEACNYRCKYCYAAWEASTCRRELIHNPNLAATLLSELYHFFRPGNDLNPLANRLTWGSVRLNLAGGEPLLHASKLPFIIDQARSLGFEVSLISNGSELDDELLDTLTPQLTWLGISIDSSNSETNRAIGRVDRRNQLLNQSELATKLAIARQHNSALRIKLNTVVNRINHEEDFSSLIQCFDPEKWKVLRMLPVVNSDMAVSDHEFDGFVARHLTFSRILSVENNEDMHDSYLMIDPYGRFFQNSSMNDKRGYAYSRPILEVGAEAAFSEIGFNHLRFNARYLTISPEVGG